MRLYLDAKSKNNIGYSPDWIRFLFNKNYEITFDIRGEIDYDETTFSCRVKGELCPWVLCNCNNGKEISLDGLDKELVDILFPIEQFIYTHEIVEIVVGIYPVDNKKDASDDVITEGKGSLQIGEKSISFVFETELNT